MEDISMLGLGDFWVSLIFVLTILSAVLCVVYGAMNWNKGGQLSETEANEEKKWDQKEREIEENL